MNISVIDFYFLLTKAFWNIIKVLEGFCVGIHRNGEMTILLMALIILEGNAILQ